MYAINSWQRYTHTHIFIRDVPSRQPTAYNCQIILIIILLAFCDHTTPFVRFVSFRSFIKYRLLFIAYYVVRALTFRLRARFGFVQMVCVCVCRMTCLSRTMCDGCEWNNILKMVEMKSVCPNTTSVMKQWWNKIFIYRPQTEMENNKTINNQEAA